MIASKMAKMISVCPRRNVVGKPQQTPEEHASASTDVSEEVAQLDALTEGEQDSSVVKSFKKLLRQVTSSGSTDALEGLVHIEKYSYPIQELLEASSVAKGVLTAVNKKFGLGAFESGIGAVGLALTLKKHIAALKGVGPEKRCLKGERVALLINGFASFTLTMAEFKQLNDDDLTHLETIATAFLAGVGTATLLTLLYHYESIQDFLLLQVEKKSHHVIEV